MLGVTAGGGGGGGGHVPLCPPPAESAPLRSRTPHRAPLLTWIYYCRFGGIVNFTLLFTTNDMISISTPQTFRSWVVIFHLCHLMAFLSLSFYDTPGIAPRINVLLWGPGDFPVSYSNRDTLWKSSFRKFYGRYRDLIQQYEVSLLRMLNDILTLDQYNELWLPNW